MKLTHIAMIACAAVLCGCASTHVIDKSFLSADRPVEGRTPISRSDPLVLKSGGDEIYGQLLRPNAAFGTGRPVVIFCHGFAGFTRMDDVAHALCRMGCVVLVPHHRGSWGSQGVYTVHNIIEDAVNLVDYATSEAFTSKCGTDPDAVFLCGYSMGGNTALHAAAQRPRVRGVILQAPCDIAECMRAMTAEQAKAFFVDNGIDVLRTEGADALCAEIRDNADSLHFTSIADAVADRDFFMATGAFDHRIPMAPLNEFWTALPDNGALRVRKEYPTSHGFMGVRVGLASDIADFIIKSCETSKAARPD